MAGIYRDSAGREVYAEEGALNSKSASRLNKLERLRSATVAALNNNPEDLPVMTTPATGALTKIYTFANSASLLLASGGIPTARIDGTGTANGFWCFPVTKIGNGVSGAGNMGGTYTGDTEDQQNSWMVTFATDADVVEFKISKPTAGRGYRFIIDGQYADLAPSDPSGVGGGSASYIKLTFASRKTRTITIEAAPGTQLFFTHVAVGPTASISYPGGSADLTALFAGDSFLEGLNNLPSPLYSFAMPDRAARRLGIRRFFNLAIGTTGYVNNGSNNRRKLVDQINHDWSRFQVYSPDLIVIANGYNDQPSMSSNAALLANAKAQALAAWQAARSLFPDALIVVCGVFAGKRNLDVDTLALENGIKAQFDAWADPFSMWVPITTDVSPWQFGTGRVGATTGDGNSDVTTGADNLHPSDYGQDYMSLRLASAVRQGIARMNA